MSAKDTLIAWLRQLPNDLTLSQILVALKEHCTEHVASPEFTWPTEDLSDDEWRLVIAQAWRTDLEDSRQDIYTEHDGAPVHGIATYG
jgi:hypothetical protein